MEGLRAPNSRRRPARPGRREVSGRPGQGRGAADGCKTVQPPPPSMSTGGGPKAAVQPAALEQCWWTSSSWLTRGYLVSPSQFLHRPAAAPTGIVTSLLLGCVLALGALSWGRRVGRSLAGESRQCAPALRVNGAQGGCMFFYTPEEQVRKADTAEGKMSARKQRVVAACDRWGG